MGSSLMLVAGTGIGEAEPTEHQRVAVEKFLRCLEFLDRALEVSLLDKHQAEIPVSRREGWIHIQRLAERVSRLRVAAQQIQAMDSSGIDDEREGVERQSAHVFGERLLAAAFRAQHLRIPLVSRGIAGVQLDGPPKFFFRGLPIVFVERVS